MKDVVTCGLLVLGTAFMALGTVGLVRMPDLFSRMQATTKSATLGIGCLLAASAVHFGQTGVSMKALLVIVFYFLTAPVAAHMIGRAAYRIGVPLWPGTRVDEMAGRFDAESHTLASCKDRETPVSDRPNT